MTDLLKKPKVLVFVRNYLPGYKSGGVLRTIANTVNWLSNDYEFWIVTRDRDLGNDEPYHEIQINEWQCVDGAMVRYLPSELITTNSLVKLIANTPHDLIHLNSYFDPVFTLRVMLARKFGWLPNTPLLLSPRGEFGDGSLKLKYAKKIIFINASKLIGLFTGITWHATSNYELQDIINVLHGNANDIKVAMDLPNKVTPEATKTLSLSNDFLRIVFISRLSREKNLDFVLRVLGKIKSKIIFDIYGPDEDVMYWKECQALIKQLPKNIAPTYHGPVAPNKVAEIFSEYDLFFFPSKGENYGHVIAESISVGTKVLISKNTPWLDLENDGLGWDVDLKNESVFVNIIENLALESIGERLKKRVAAKEGALKRLLDPIVVKDNRELFRITD
jgi:glycosyltransferase involved in cell wall biosynthesis